MHSLLPPSLSLSSSNVPHRSTSANLCSRALQVAQLRAFVRYVSNPLSFTFQCFALLIKYHRSQSFILDTFKEKKEKKELLNENSFIRIEEKKLQKLCQILFLGYKINYELCDAKKKRRMVETANGRRRDMKLQGAMRKVR